MNTKANEHYSGPGQFLCTKLRTRPSAFSMSSFNRRLLVFLINRYGYEETVFWDTAPCSPLNVKRRLHLQDRISRARYQSEKHVTSQVIDWPEILDYVGSRREMEEWTSVLIGSPVGQNETSGLSRDRRANQ
jgi:hypothetical protein